MQQCICATMHMCNNYLYVYDGNQREGCSFLFQLSESVLDGCSRIAVIYLSHVYMALWVMVLSRFSAPLITLAPTAPPACLFISVMHSFKCNADNFEEVRCNLQGIEREHMACKERPCLWKSNVSTATRIKDFQCYSDAITLAMLRAFFDYYQQ